MRAARGFACILTVLLSLAITGCVEKGLQPGERIVFLGDSITWQGDKPGGYVTMVRDTLQARYPDLNLEIIGAGISGNKVPDLQARLQRDVVDHNPSKVFIYIGINDVWHWAKFESKGTTKAVFQEGLRDIIARISHNGARVYLCTPTVIGERHDGTNPQDTMLDEYAALSRQVAEGTGAILVDLRQAFIDCLHVYNPDNAEDGILTYDGVHLIAAGNRLVAQEVLKALGE
ncbi:Acetylxylan esterase [subsurface metagenome]